MAKRITICMGSSCFCRGNNQNLIVIEKYLARHNGQDQVELTGSHCEGRCAEGPNIRFDRETFGHMDQQTLIDLLESRLFEKDKP